MTVIRTMSSQGKHLWIKFQYECQITKEILECHIDNLEEHFKQLYSVNTPKIKSAKRILARHRIRCFSKTQNRLQKEINTQYWRQLKCQNRGSPKIWKLNTTQVVRECTDESELLKRTIRQEETKGIKANKRLTKLVTRLTKELDDHEEKINYSEECVDLLDEYIIPTPTQFRMIDYSPD